jgi:hypothetical protein
VRKRVGDARARLAIAVKRVGRGPAAPDVLLDRRGNSGGIMLDVYDVAAALASCLAAADVHRRHAQERTFPDGHARVADNRGGLPEQPEEILGQHVPEKVKVRWLFLLAEHANPLRGAIRSGIHVRPEPQHRQPRVLHGVERLLHLLPRLVVLGGHRMLHDDEIAI